MSFYFSIPGNRDKTFLSCSTIQTSFHSHIDDLRQRWGWKGWDHQNSRCFLHRNRFVTIKETKQSTSTLCCSQIYCLHIRSISIELTEDTKNGNLTNVLVHNKVLKESQHAIRTT